MDIQEYLALFIVFFVFMKLAWGLFSRPFKKVISQWLLNKGQIKLAMRVKF